MSFLAKLREQNALPGQGMHLSYVLRVEPFTRLARLHLYLTDPKEGLTANSGRYTIQRQHLERPPSFLSSEDLELLQALVSSDEGWIGQSEGAFPEKADATLRTMLKTRRCFIQLREKEYVAITQGEDRKIEPAWTVALDGSQRLDWQVPEGASPVLLSPDCLALPWLFYPASQQLCPSLHGYSNDALMLARTEPTRLQPNEVEQFISRNKSDWLHRELPLPVILPRENVEARIVPLLVCDSVRASGKVRDTISLALHCATEDVCLLTSENETPLYWDGGKLNLAEIGDRQQDAFRENINTCLRQVGFDRASEQSWSCSNEENWRQLLVEHRQGLERQGFQFLFRNAFRFPFVTSGDWSASLSQNGNDYIHFSASLIINGQIVHLLELLTRLRESNQLGDHLKVTMQNGLILLLPKKMSELMEEIADLIGDGDSEIRLHKNQVARLNAIREYLPESTNWSDKNDVLEQARQLCASPLIQQNRIPGLHAELRPYQWLGVCWLQHLTARGVNGLLADDMGLGKTLQAIAHLCLEHERGRLCEPALIVVPTSLLHNWRNELERFAPRLKCLVLHGTQRSEHWPELQHYQVLITSYHLAVRDLETWRRQKLSWLILDEAQVIKNRQTQVRQAVNEISAAHRLCLSGTPVENHLGELWSIFDFLLPGCLGDYPHFQRHYRKPIEEQADNRRLQKLLEHIAPFILRRTKNQIATELPPKTVIHQTIDMDDAQREFYQALKKQSVADLEQQMVEAQGAGTQQIVLLAALTRLRQACCDPALLGADDIASAKREYCIDMIREVVDEGRALLVFSQFTRMLDLIAEDLEREKIDFLMLTGETHNRQEKVDAFQNGDAPVFLISLKAGGVGLNLTRADTVIHFDPWWNSAAEEQASDRAHRIGQDKPVFVYKLIMEDTIEEKIVKMQERKFALGAHVSQQAELSGQQFSLKLEDLLLLWQSETQPDNHDG